VGVLDQPTAPATLPGSGHLWSYAGVRRAFRGP
jgi:hypothetical protein